MAALRIGVLADKDARFAFWERRLFNALCTDERFALAAILKTDRPADGGPPLYRLSMKAESLLFARAPVVEDAAFEAASTSIPAIQLSAGEDLSRLKLDLVLKHAGGPIPEALLTAARFGVWSFDFNARPDDKRALAGYWEVRDRAGVSPVSLIAFDSTVRQGRVIAAGAFNTKFCASRNASFVKDKSIALLLRELGRLASGSPPAGAGVPYTPPEKSYPGLVSLARYGAGVARNLAGRVVNAVAAKAGARPGMWHLRVGEGDLADFDPASGVDIIPDGNRYWADPFLLSENGENFIFFEDYDYRTRTGVISVGRQSPEGFEFLGVALKTNCHLSYPYLFRHEGALYMMPETVGNNRIEIWRCVDFPFEWRLQATALDGSLPADSVLFQRDGAWWLFTNLSTDAYGDHCSDLFVYRVDGPALTSLEPHRLNPVVVDSATGRNGGRVFERAGKLYRVSQDNSFGTYGYGVNLMEIERLSLEDYGERLVRKIAPDFAPGLIGCHHMDAVNSRWVLDARKRWGGFPQRKRSTPGG
ncbi:MAG: hypothetical protein WD076_07195 [Parvularculaceae bacterium]